MFNVGPMELIVILLVALLIVGPKRLPEVGRSIGKSLREFRRATDEVRYSFESSLDDDGRDETADPEPSDEHASPDGSEPTRRQGASAEDHD
jgi:TatA/E family protein of Tat protein translocase